MSTVKSGAEALSKCPVTDFADLHVSRAPAGWHFANFDAKRAEGAVHRGTAGDHDYVMLTRMADIRASYQNASVFSNSSVTPTDPEPSFMLIPEMLDGRLHKMWRQLTGPLFSPQAAARLEPTLRQRFGEILDEVAPRGECDFVHDVAMVFPNTIFMDIMGLPRSDAEQFQQWETAMLHTAGPALGDEQAGVMMAVVGYFTELIEDRRQHRRDDLLSVAVTWTIDGQLVPDDELLSFCLLMFLAGLDTVATQLAFNFWHLATHEEDRRRIVADPGLIPAANEEFLRYFSFVTPGRKVVTDTEVAGCPIKAGQMAYLPLVAANRDPEEFERADEVVIDRETNRHIAFGAGPHRCLGSHLARQELRVAMEMWHERIPDYAVRTGETIMEHGGQVGIANLPLEWSP